MVIFRPNFRTHIFWISWIEKKSTDDIKIIGNCSQKLFPFDCNSTTHPGEIQKQFKSSHDLMIIAFVAIIQRHPNHWWSMWSCRNLLNSSQKCSCWCHEKVHIRNGTNPPLSLHQNVNGAYFTIHWAFEHMPYRHSISVCASCVQYLSIWSQW